MTIDYQNITQEELEEKIEFIDWSKISIHLLNDNIKNNFGFLRNAKIRFWLEDLLKKLEIKVDKKKYPDSVFFFIEDQLYIDFDLEKRYFWCSYEKIWSVFEREYSISYSEIQLFIKNVVEMHFKNSEITPLEEGSMFIQEVEQHFKNLEITPKKNLRLSIEKVENHFKNIEITPSYNSTSKVNKVEQHFKNMEIRPLNLGLTEGQIVEQHFKNMEIIPCVERTVYSCLVEKHFKKLENS